MYACDVFSVVFFSIVGARDALSSLLSGDLPLVGRESWRRGRRQGGELGSLRSCLQVPDRQPQRHIARLTHQRLEDGGQGSSSVQSAGARR